MAPIEVGVFDLSRLPVVWGSVDPAKVERAVQAISASIPDQVAELQRSAHIERLSQEHLASLTFVKHAQYRNELLESD